LGCLNLRAQQSLKVFKNRVLRRIFGPKRDEMKGRWRKPLSKKVGDLKPGLHQTLLQRQNEGR
jgi:hypothetical protein